jgi:hypothetical protein
VLEFRTPVPSTTVYESDHEPGAESGGQGGQLSPVGQAVRECQSGQPERDHQHANDFPAGQRLAENGRGPDGDQ